MKRLTFVRSKERFNALRMNAGLVFVDKTPLVTAPQALKHTRTKEGATDFILTILFKRRRYHQPHEIPEVRTCREVHDESARARGQSHLAIFIPMQLRSKSIMAEPPGKRAKLFI